MVKDKKEKPLALLIADTIINAIIAISALITAISRAERLNTEGARNESSSIPNHIIQQRKEICK